MGDIGINGSLAYLQTVQDKGSNNAETSHSASSLGFKFTPRAALSLTSLSTGTPWPETETREI